MAIAIEGAPAYQIGLLAQDVEKTVPGAVIELNGYKAVDYRAATAASRRWTRRTDRRHEFPLIPWSID